MGQGIGRRGDEFGANESQFKTTGKCGNFQLHIELYLVNALVW